MTDKHETPFQPSIPPLEPDCDCPPGAWHLRSCDLVYWPSNTEGDCPHRPNVVPPRRDKTSGMSSPSAPVRDDAVETE